MLAIGWVGPISFFFFSTPANSNVIIMAVEVMGALGVCVSPVANSAS